VKDLRHSFLRLAIGIDYSQEELPHIEDDVSGGEIPLQIGCHLIEGRILQDGVREMEPMVKDLRI
jgi:hypothetical protein